MHIQQQPNSQQPTDKTACINNQYCLHDRPIHDASPPRPTHLSHLPYLPYHPSIILTHPSTKPPHSIPNILIIIYPFHSNLSPSHPLRPSTNHKPQPKKNRRLPGTFPETFPGTFPAYLTLLPIKLPTFPSTVQHRIRVIPHFTQPFLSFPCIQ